TVTLSPSITDSYLINVAVQQPLFTGFRISSGIKQADSLAAINRYNIEKTRREIKYTITVAYWSIVRVREFLNVLEESINLSLEHLKNVENLLSNGLATKNDLLKVKMRLSEIRLKKSDAENMLKLAQLRMSILLGLPKDTGFPFSFSDTGGTYELKSLDSLMDSVFTHRPEYAILLNKIKAGDAALAIARSSLYPSIFLKAQYTYARPNQRIFPAVDEFTGTWDIGIFASLDLGNYSRIFQKIQQAETDVQKSREELDQTADAIMFELTSNYIDYTTSLKNIALQQEIIDQAEENYKDVKEKFKSGVVLNQEVLEAENSLLQARLSYTGAVIDSEIALSALVKSSGETE
ncbi:MAG: TolC family protein, partial [Spirochaetales bacterium]|nr:TolC family protein [Spirochaetales bacterium]